MQIEVGIGQSKVRLAILRFALQGGLEVSSGGAGSVHVVEDVSTIHVGRNYVGVAVKHVGKITQRLLSLPVMFVHIPGQ